MKLTLAFLVASLITSGIVLVVVVAFNATVANDPGNDLGMNTGWAVLTPAPAVSLVWTLVDIAVYFFWRYHVIHWLVTCVFLGALNTAIGITGILLYEWDEASWVMGMFVLFAAIGYFAFMGFAAKAVHSYRHGQSGDGTALKNVESAESQ